MHICSYRHKRQKSSRTHLWYTMEISDSFLSLTSKWESDHRSHRFAGLTSRHGVIKYCDEFPGFTRYKDHQPFGASEPKRVSVPRSHAKHPTDTYPDASEVTIRKAISTFLPRFADRPIFNRTMCWCTDTADAALLICEHPKWKNFILATGDSGSVL